MGVKVGFTVSQFPDILLTTDQIKAGQETIMGKVLNLKKVGGKLKFVDANFKQ